MDDMFLFPLLAPKTLGYSKGETWGKPSRLNLGPAVLESSEYSGDPAKGPSHSERVASGHPEKGRGPEADSPKSEIIRRAKPND